MIPCSPAIAFCSIVGHARRHTAGTIGPSTIERSNFWAGLAAVSLFVMPLPPRRLHVAAPLLRRETLLARAGAWSGGTPLLRPLRGVLQERDEPRARGVAILRLRPVFAAVDEQHP